MKGKCALNAKALLAGIACAMLEFGCAAPLQTTDPAATGNFAILESLPATDAIDAHDLYPFEPGSIHYREIEPDGGSEGELITFVIDAADQFDAAVRIDRGDGRSEFEAEGEDGGLVLTASIDESENALTRFDPPLPIAPAKLAAGEPFESKAAMRVLSAADPAQQRESGTATRTIEYVRDERIRTSLGTFRAKRIEMQFFADLRMANAHTNETYWLVPERGIIARDHTERIDILGMSGKEKRQTLVMIEK